jgi:hypothetical protein
MELEYSYVAGLVDSSIDSITITPDGLANSRERAAEFLVVQAVLTTYLKQVSENLAKSAALRDATFANSIKKTEGKNITEKKINVASDETLGVLEKNCSDLEALREWVKGHVKIFENAHILYRGLSRE